MADEKPTIEIKPKTRKERKEEKERAIMYKNPAKTETVKETIKNSRGVTKIKLKTVKTFDLGTKKPVKKATFAGFEKK